MADIVLDQVHKRYGSLTVVDAMSLDIKDGEFVVFVGPSGCGKSTTLRMIAGLEDISHGAISIGGRDVTNLEPKDRNIAMVFQNYALYPHKSVYENLAFGMRMRKAPKAEIAQQVKWAAEMLGIENLLDRKPRQLSGGQMQRVSLGRALVRRPDAFLLDEPLSNLDAKLRIHMREELALLHKRIGTSMVYVTHDQVEAMTLGDRIVVMQGGKAQQIGTPLEIYDSPANIFVAGFLGAPEMNFIDGNIFIRDGKPCFRAADFEVALPERRIKGAALPDGSAVTLGVRPEHLRLGTTAADAGDVAHTDHIQISGKVQLIEQMGAQTVLVCSTPATQHLRVLCERLHDVAVAAPCSLSVQLQRIHLFSKETGDSLLLAA